MSGKGNDSPSGGSTGSGRVDTRDLINHYMETGDQDAISAFGETDRAAVGVMHRMQPMSLGPQAGMGAPHMRQYGAAPAQLQSKGTQQAQHINFQLGPPQKNSAPEKEHKPQQEFELPLALNMMSMFDDTDQEMMFMEEEPEDDGIPPLEKYESGCKTSLVSSRAPEDVRQALQFTLAIIESQQPSEISHQDEGWQMRVEYIYNNTHASVNLRLLEIPENKEVAIQFSRVDGSGVVFQRFYRLCTAELKNHLSDVRGLGNNAMPTMFEDKFDRSDITVDGKVVHEALENHLRLIGSAYNRTVEPQREVTSAIVQIVQRHPVECLNFAKQNAQLAYVLTNAMSECSGDLEVMRNCVRILSILMESGKDCDPLYVKLDKAKEAAFTIVAQCIAEWVKTAEPAAIATMVCNDLCHFLDLLIKNYYSKARVQCPEKGVAALFTIGSASAPERYAQVQQQCRGLSQIAVSV